MQQTVQTAIATRITTAAKDEEEEEGEEDEEDEEAEVSLLFWP